MSSRPSTLRGAWGPSCRPTPRRRATELLLSGLDRLERGCWDYFDDNAKALADYEDWCQGMFTEVGDRALPSAPIQPYRGEPRYLTFTMAALVIQGTSTDHVLLELSEVPPARLWKRETFARLLRGLGDLDFTHVKSDVLYLIPRDEAWGLRTQELSTKRFDYLRPVVE